MLAVIPKIENNLPEHDSRDVYIDLGDEARAESRPNETQSPTQYSTNNSGTGIFSQYANNEGNGESDKGALVKRSLEEISLRIELFVLRIIQTMKGCLLKNQTILLKNVIRWSYVAVMVFSIMNAGLFFSLQTKWITAGAKTFSFCIVVSLGSLSTLLWYMKYRVVPSKYEDMPHLLSAMAWNVPIGIAETIAYSALTLGWLNMIGGQITSMIILKKRHVHVGKLTPLFVFLAGMGIFISFLPILLVRISEFAIILERENLICKKSGNNEMRDPIENEDVKEDNSNPAHSNHAI